LRTHSLFPAATVVPAGLTQVKLIAGGDRVAATRPFEPESLTFWTQQCKLRSGMFVDVGAYTGIYSLAAAMMGRQVIAFEPNPAVNVRLRANLRMNAVEHAVTVHASAVSDQDGELIPLYANIIAPLTSAASLIPREGKKLLANVRTVRLDDVLRGKDVSFIKLDVERNEPKALVGARETLERCKPLLLVEVLGAEERDAVLAAVPNYRVMHALDQRNIAMEYNG